MHVCNQQIRAAIVVKIEKFDPHRTPGSLRKIFSCLFDKLLAPLIFVVVRRSLHVQEEDARPPRPQQIGEARFPAPSVRVQAHLGGHVLEMIVTHMFVQHWIFVPLGVQMPGERRRNSHVFSVRSLLVRSVFADVAYQQVH